ncbi:MAG: two-component sensor histidine kinase, partial [Deltaproteobacteria bacterium]|nr:two-component sensor histidine kinase [Deltaproteobacteria bacterium]
EIRNPLSSLDLNADLLRDEVASDGSKEEALLLLGAMQDEIERLTRITEAYLRFARLPSPVLSVTHLHRVITNTVDFMASQLAELKIDVELKLDANPDSAPFDREQMVQVLINLMRNAIQAMPDGGRIFISTDRRDGLLTMRVTDTGSGISSDSAASIFDPFFTTKSDGTGLGLAMVRQICLAHGGNIQYIDRAVASNSGDAATGATFEISIPVAKKEQI